MRYAVIKSGGKQYRVLEGKEVLLDRLNIKEGASITFPEVLLVRNEEEVIVGNPLVKEAIVRGMVKGETKGEKIRVSKFKAKVRYRRTIGFRPQYTKVLIEKISFSKDAVSNLKIKTEEKKKRQTRVKSLDSREKKS